MPISMYTENESTRYVSPETPAVPATKPTGMEAAFWVTAANKTPGAGAGPGFSSEWSRDSCSPAALG